MWPRQMTYLDNYENHEYLRQLDQLSQRSHVSNQPSQTHVLIYPQSDLSLNPLSENVSLGLNLDLDTNHIRI